MSLLHLLREALGIESYIPTAVRIYQQSTLCQSQSKCTVVPSSVCGLVLVSGRTRFCSFQLSLNSVQNTVWTETEFMAEVCSTKSVLCRLSPCVNRAGHCLENSQRASGCVEDSLMRWCKTKRTSSEVKKVISTKMTMKMSNWRVHEIQEVKNCPMN